MAPTCLPSQIQPLTGTNEACVQPQLTPQVSPMTQPAPLLPSPALKPQGLETILHHPCADSLATPQHPAATLQVSDQTQPQQDVPWSLKPHTTAQLCPLSLLYSSARAVYLFDVVHILLLIELILSLPESSRLIGICVSCSQLYLLYLEKGWAYSRSPVNIYGINSLSALLIPFPLWGKRFFWLETYYHLKAPGLNVFSKSLGFSNPQHFTYPKALHCLFAAEFWAVWGLCLSHFYSHIMLHWIGSQPPLVEQGKRMVNYTRGLIY